MEMDVALERSELRPTACMQPIVPLNPAAGYLATPSAEQLTRIWTNRMKNLQSARTDLGVTQKD